MADPTKQKPSPFARMLADGAAKERELQRDAEALMDKMIALHGGAWRMSIDHSRYFIMIARDCG